MAKRLSLNTKSDQPHQEKEKTQELKNHLTRRELRVLKAEDIVRILEAKRAIYILGTSRPLKITFAELS